jgi:outer membrane protein TolC
MRPVLLVIVIAASAVGLSAQQSGSVTATQLPVPGTTTSINTLNPSVIVQGPYAGSASSLEAMPFTGRLSLADALARGLGYNLGILNATSASRAVDGEAHVARSALLPHVEVDYVQTRRDTNLEAAGIHIDLPLPGFVFPTLVSAFNVVDVRGHLSQSIVNLSDWKTFRAARESVRESDFLLQDARDLVTLAVGAAYLQVLASQARVVSARAQLETAEALNAQTSAERRVGLLAQIDVNRTHVEVLTQRQRLVSLQTDLTRQKINLARLTGLPPTDQYDVAGDVPYAPAPALAIDEAIAEALAQRADVKAADAAVRAAEQRRTAASAERLPTVSLNADYGAIGTDFSDVRGTFAFVGTVRRYGARATLRGWAGRSPRPAGRRHSPATARRTRQRPRPGDGRCAQRLVGIAGGDESGRPRDDESRDGAGNIGSHASAIPGGYYRFARGGARAGKRGDRGSRLHQQRLCSQPRKAGPRSRPRQCDDPARALPRGAVSAPRCDVHAGTQRGMMHTRVSWEASLSRSAHESDG